MWAGVFSLPWDDDDSRGESGSVAGMVLFGFAGGDVVPSVRGP
jgi:hypothetical protein